ncbi:MAG: formylglycine-generating enzyme family protein [Parvibaculaceae bacterium]|nr:formylglycine-generating enzyme family protein [Parvibaculaceae bacterium]
MIRLSFAFSVLLALAACPMDTQKTLRDCDTCPDLIRVDAGTFMRGADAGDPAADESEYPRHEVTIRKPFAIAKHLVTRADFETFVAETGHDANGGCYIFAESGWRVDRQASWRAPGFAQSHLDPVVCISWHDANAYAAWMSARTGKSYRLPSEAEWELAARGGTAGTNFWGEDDTLACTYANVNDITAKNKAAKAAENCDDGFMFTSPVGQFLPNPYGLHDAVGNVWVWTADCWQVDYGATPRDESAHLAGGCERRVLRGGSWTDTPGPVRIGAREHRSPEGRYSIAGFRLVRDLD